MTKDERLKSLDGVLKDMQGYLLRLEQGCASLPLGTRTNNKEFLEKLVQIMEGMAYFQKLLISAGVLLHVAPDEELSGTASIASYSTKLCGILDGIYQATENEDYSLAADLAEYDLSAAIQLAQSLLTVLQGRYAERGC